MKANEIVKALTGSDKANKDVKNQCKTFADIFTMFKEIKKEIVSVDIISAPFYLGSYSTVKFLGSGPEVETTKGDEMPGEIWTIKTAKGTYKQTIPTGNDFYFAFRALLSDFVPMAALTENRIADFEMEFTKEQTTIIKAAIGFCSNDSFRPAMNGVKIEMKKEGLVNVIATDAHKLYFEQFFLSAIQKDLYSKNEIEFLLPAKDLKKVKGCLNVELFKGEHNFENGKMNGLNFDLISDQFPNYINVWPQYEKYVEVLKADLVSSVKQILPFANKVTHQVNFYFNGCVAMNTEDIDFGNESGIKIPYLSKTTEDFEISFNGKFLLECLASIPGNNVKLYSNGISKQAVILNDIALLCPVMKNQYV